MGVQKIESEAASTVPAAKMFKGMCIDVDSIVTKAFPEGIKKVEILEGNGGVGTIKHLTLGDANPFNTMKQRVDEIDEEGMSYTYTIIGGDILLDFIESTVTHFKVIPTATGCVVKNTIVFNTKGDAVVSEDNIKIANEQSAAVFKAVEAYLLAN